MPWNLKMEPEGARLMLTGQVDIFEAAPLHDALRELAGAEGPVHVDLARCDDLDTAALQVLVAFQRARRGRGRPVSFAWQSGRVGRLLARLGLDRALGNPAA
jgi:ABC-type transporter Mla MlaB component